MSPQSLKIILIMNLLGVAAAGVYAVPLPAALTDT